MFTEPNAYPMVVVLLRIDQNRYNAYSQMVQDQMRAMVLVVQEFETRENQVFTPDVLGSIRTFKDQIDTVFAQPR